LEGVFCLTAPAQYHTSKGKGAYIHAPDGGSIAFDSVERGVFMENALICLPLLILFYVTWSENKKTRRTLALDLAQR